MTSDPAQAHVRVQKASAALDKAVGKVADLESKLQQANLAAQEAAREFNEAQEAERIICKTKLEGDKGDVAQAGEKKSNLVIPKNYGRGSTRVLIWRIRGHL